MLQGAALLAALWWAYFDHFVFAAESNLSAAQGHERARLARDSYVYLHLLMVGGIIFVALGLEETLAHVGEPPAVPVQRLAMHVVFGVATATAAEALLHRGVGRSHRNA